MALTEDDRELTIEDWEAEEIAAAAREAGAIGGHAGDEDLDPALRPLIEAGEGESEGFELAEEELIAAAEGADGGLDPLANAFSPELDSHRERGEYAEADQERSSASTNGGW